ncbi:endo-1,3-alpha-glucanase family glycosylhydrolase [Gracilinema caldarium]|uniref:endo-1,3-alpha-glucanase family glycosylhydrolase n=1 Tax=Gracilinema caldarium TaxID=215591 RepID=UPI0026ED22BA|nr:endo-1,3-alpha-glucanase family glycosylhydrolase [Gracilinema caldarium]
MGGTVFDPFETLPDGRAKIASHYYPLTGPYDTRDIEVLRYQVALMKIAGIDGVIFDWYGIEDALDYKEIHQSVMTIIPILKQAGLKFVFCYEDQSIGKMIEAKAITKTQAVETGKKAFAWLQKNVFQDESYVKFENRPVVLCFGPQYFKEKSQWEVLFSETHPRPYLVSLDNHSEQFADGSYNWPLMWASTAGKLSLSRLVSNLNDFYTKQSTKPHLVATIFPGFHDIYQEAGAGRSYGFLDYADGETFKLTMDAALKANPDIIQIATWNDYGEGTIIEPTIERGYRELEYIQDVKKTYAEEFPFSRLDLRIPIELYKAYTKAGSEKEKNYIISIYDRLFAAKIDEVRRLMKEAALPLDFAIRPVLRTTESKSVTKQAESLFDTAGKKNIALGMPVVASSHIYDFVASKANDGDVASYWEGGASTYPNIFTVDLVNSRLLDVMLIKLNPKRIWSKRVQRIEVLYSEDGNQFFKVIEPTDYSFDPAGNGNFIVIKLNVKARYLRLIFTGNTQAKAGQIAELEVYAAQ